MRNLPIYIIALFFLTGCFHFEFDNKDLIEYNAHSVGDTIAFVNENGKTDTYLVSKKEIERLDPSGNIWYRAMTATVRFQDLLENKYQKKIITYPDTIYQDAELLVAYKSTPSEKPRVELYFKSFIGEIEEVNNNRVIFNGVKSLKISRFDLTTARKDTDLTYIYWNETIGIIGYEFKNGETWKRINMPQHSI